MFRKIICTLFALLSLPMLTVPGRASRQEGSIRVCPDWGGDMVSGGSVTLYRVGEPVVGGYRLTDGLADWTVWEEDVFSREVRDWLLGQNPSGGICVEVAPITGALFSGLAAGLYLAVQDHPAPGFAVFSPVLIGLPQDGFWDIGLNPQVIRDTESPQTGDHPAPIIGAMGIGFSVAALMVLLDSRKDK